MSEPIREFLDTLESPEYLGDGAYVGLRVHGFPDVVLFTSDGVVVTNEVYLGERELQVFEEWVARQKAEAKKRRG